MYTSLFWKDFFERLLATLAQVFLGLLTADVVGNNVTSFAGLPWEVYALVLLVAAVGVLAKSLAAGRVVDTVSPASFAPAAPDLPAVAEEEVTRLDALQRVNVDDESDVAARRI